MRRAKRSGSRQGAAGGGRVASADSGLDGCLAASKIIGAAAREIAIEVEAMAERAALADHLRTAAPGVARLFRELLKRNLNALLGQGGRAVRDPQWERNEALKWITSDEEGYVFSFRVVCAALGLNPDYIRSRALAGREDIAA